MSSINVNPPGGVNAQTVINDAINSVSNSGGGTVWLAPGVFTISQPVYMKNNVTLSGTIPEPGQVHVTEIRLLPGAAVTNNGNYWYIPVANRFPEKNNNLAKHSLILSINASNVTICQLRVNPSNNSHWNGTKQLIARGRGMLTCIEFSGGSNVCVHDVAIGGETKTGFNDGILSQTVSGTVRFYNNWIQPGQGHDGIYVKRSTDVKIYNNTIYANTNASIRVGDSIAEIYGNYCIGGTWQHNQCMQLDRNNTAYATKLDVHDNIIENAYNPGIQVTSTVAATAENHVVRIHHNIFRNCGIKRDTNYTAAIYCGARAMNVTIDHNTIDASNGCGIVVRAYSSDSDGTGSNIYIDNNIISNTKSHVAYSETYPGYGIANYTKAKLHITNNCFWNNAGGDYYGTTIGANNINADPQYVVSGSDYHLKSVFGSYHNSVNTFVKDNLTSPCVRLGTGSEIGRYNGAWDQSRQVDVAPPVPVKPTANFRAAPVWGSVPLVVNFVDLSLGNPTAWLWEVDMTRNVTAITKNVTVTYNRSDTFTIRLTVSNSMGSDTMTRTDYITAGAGTPIIPPVVDFTANITSGSNPLSVEFTDETTGSPNAWLWNFGDNTTSVARNPSHVYENPGTYTVKLIASNSLGTDAKVKAGYITVVPYNQFIKPAHDVRLREITPDTPYPGTTYNDVGATSTGRFRSLLWFNLDAYKDKKISKAVLRLYWYYPATVRQNDTVVEVYKPTVIWDPEAITWNSPRPGKTWSHPGGDWSDLTKTYQGDTPYGSITFKGTDVATKKYYDIEVTELVKRYLDGTYQNYGFLIKAKDEILNYIAFYSLECGTDVAIPKLVITEEVPIPVKTLIYVAGDDSGTFNCDGKDDHLQINQALKQVNDNPTLYSGVYLKGPFTYTINDTLLIGADCSLEGDATAVIKLKDNCLWATTKPMIKERATAISNVQITGFKIDGNRSNQNDAEGAPIVSGKGFHNLIHFTNVTNVAIHNMYLTNNHGDGLKTDNCTSVEFYNNTVYLLGHDGLYCSNGNYIDAYGNTITCRINNGLRIYNANHVNFHNNKITSQGSGSAGITIQKYGTYIMDDVQVFDNEIYGTALSAIWCFSSSSYNANTSMLHIHHNKIYDAGTKNTTSCGGIIFNGFNALIENNDIDGCYKGGILFKNIYSESPIITGTPTATLRSNNITNARSGYGVEKESSAASQSVVFQNNCIYGNLGGSVNGIPIPTGDTANILVDPLYADPASHDYHLKSKAGRFNGSKWVVDLEKSPCIDGGYRLSEWQNEPGGIAGSGERINIGMYGNTIYASMSGDFPIALNHAPVMPTITNKTIEISHTLTFSIESTDVDNDILTYSATNLPTGASLNADTGIFTWTPSISQEGTYHITFTVTDGDLTDSKIATIGVIKQEVIIYTGGKIFDCKLRQASPTEVINNSPYLDFGGRDGVGAYRGLIQIDLSEYIGATINNAALYLYWYHPDGQERVNDTVLEIYSPLPWDLSYANWINRTEAATWVTPGGDWLDKLHTLNGNVPYATVTLNADEVPTNGYVAFDVTDLIQEYANETIPNSGFLIKAKNELNNYIGFYSSKFGLKDFKPNLSVQYTK